MEIEILSPSGYCYGVKNAINIALNIRNKHPKDNVYILGMLVHNEFVCDFLASKGIKTLNVSPNEYAETLQKLHNGDVIIFTAHGHDEKLNELADKLGLKWYDAICPMVAKNITLIKNALKNKMKVLYIGQENHPEAIAATSISKEVKLIPNKVLDNYYFNTKEKVFCINQTTLNYKDILKTFEDISGKYKNCIISNEVCAATRLRQDSIINLDNSFDALIIVGSKKSSNTNKLYDIAIKQFPNLKVFRIQEKRDIDLAYFKDMKKVAITGGTSTPLYLLQLIKNYLETID